MRPLVKPVLFFGSPAIIACDGRCEKAWGINNRPRNQLSDDPDDYEWLSDGELGTAPTDPGTYEGGHAKPRDYSDPQRQNKWCARECERHRLVDAGELLVVRDLSVRFRNKPTTEGT